MDQPSPPSPSAPAAGTAPASRRTAAVQIAAVLGVLLLWITALKLLGGQELLKAWLPSGWVYLDIFTTGIVGLSALALTLRLSRQGWRSVGLEATPVGPAIGWGLLATPPCYVAGAIAQLLAMAALRQSPTQLASRKMAALEILSDVPLSLVLPIALFAGVYEEILFRGFLLSRLTTLLDGAALGRRGATAAAVLLSSLLFGLGHAYQGIPGMAQTFAVGVVLSGVAVLRGNVWSCIAAHAAIDVFGLLALRVLAPMMREAVDAPHAPDGGT